MGGGTLRSGALQLLHSSPTESAARSQWPRAAHSGLMHCTVHPGKYCTLSPSFGVSWSVARFFRLRSAFPAGLAAFAADRAPLRSPGPAPTEKVAGSLRWYSCGVKRKDTIDSSGVAEGAGRRRSWHSDSSLSSFTTFQGLPTICPSSVVIEGRAGAKCAKGFD